MITAENIASAYVSRRNYRDADGAQNWGEWAQHNPEAEQLLNNVEIIVNATG